MFFIYQFKRQEKRKTKFNIETTKAGLFERARQNNPTASEAEIERLATMPVLDQIGPLLFSDAPLASSDVGDVSWVCPTAQVLIGCEPQGTPPHSWQWVATGKSSIAHKGLIVA